jgi:hypothetical protein
MGAGSYLGFPPTVSNLKRGFMAKAVADIDHSDKTGHGEDSPKPTVKKGIFISPATFAPLASSGDAISPNKKTGTSSGGSQ